MRWRSRRLVTEALERRRGAQGGGVAWRHSGFTGWGPPRSRPTTGQGQPRSESPWSPHKGWAGSRERLGRKVVPAETEASSSASDKHRAHRVGVMGLTPPPPPPTPKARASPHLWGLLCERPQSCCESLRLQLKSRAGHRAPRSLWSLRVPLQARGKQVRYQPGGPGGASPSRGSCPAGNGPACPSPMQDPGRA